ncbi:hypothetical protein N7U66_02050 [Lacinutrix neustonica]|uniref:Uncharacterized protein n=1 Tax=Lacinutrix neustonica TaxID=2980107 RepID=A0A9E8MYB9_9FLAO|nr:hypothetical protein [Lacinutrix neustonica]WAC02519.1 hypothetical protein N7U66_02050 [Lacinutrix neustonica]
MKTVLLSFAIVFSGLLSAQDIYTQKNTEIHDAEAQRITNAYNSQLALDANQFLIFEKKIEEFLIKRAKIEERFKGKEKLDMLYKMQARETKEMNDILTRPQLALYKRIKSEIQPLMVVKEK